MYFDLLGVFKVALEDLLIKPKEDKMKKFSLLGLLALSLMVFILGCNTARGVGTDIKDTGEHIENIGK